MQTLYDWLLYNTEDAGNYYTILNTKRDETGGLTIMARSSDFTIVNLLIRASESSGSSDNRLDKMPGDRYLFADEHQVIAYLTDGKIPEAQPSGDATGIHVLVTEPAGAAGDITFPPAQA